MLLGVWLANTQIKIHKYTNTVWVKFADRPNMCYTFEKLMVRGLQKQCSRVSDMQIHKHNYTNTQIHKYGFKNNISGCLTCKYTNTQIFLCWFFHRFLCWSFHRFFHRFSHRFLCWFFHRFFHQFFHRFFHWFFHRFLCWFFHWFLCWFFHHRFFHWFFHRYRFFHWASHWYSYRFSQLFFTISHKFFSLIFLPIFQLIFQ